MKVQVRYFASLRETIGQGSEMVDTDSRDVASLRAQLMARGGVHAECLGTHRPVRVAVNQVMATEATPLSDDCEVAFFSPCDWRLNPWPTASPSRPKTSMFRRN